VARQQLAGQFVGVFEKQSKEVTRKFWFYHK